MADVDDTGVSFCGWSWEENKEFEMALAVVDEDNPERWKEIASMIGGKKSVEEVRKHYEALLVDLDIIESGRLDQELGVQHGAWTDDDQKKQIDLLFVIIKAVQRTEHRSDLRATILLR